VEKTLGGKFIYKMLQQVEALWIEDQKKNVGCFGELHLYYLLRFHTCFLPISSRKNVAF